MVNRAAILALCGLWCACLDRQQILFAAPFDAGAAVGDGGPDAGQPTRGATDVSTGDLHACAVVSGALWCWGSNAHGELGLGVVGDDQLVPRRLGTSTSWARVSAGLTSSCALTTQGDVWCWGHNQSGEVGNGTFVAQTEPWHVALARPAKSVRVSTHSCAVLNDDTVWCWGANQEGQLGLDEGGLGSNQPSPVALAPGTRWRDVAPGDGHTCGIHTDGTLWCWGRNTGHQLGLGEGSPGQTRAPTRVGADSTWVNLSAHQEGACAVKANGTLWCWGGSSEADIGQRIDAVPIQVGADTDWSTSDSETFFTCGQKTNGAVWCWGRNLEGQLGAGTFINDFVPAPRGHATSGRASVGRFSRCVVESDTTVTCTGKNDHGQVGVGDHDDRDALVPLRFE